MKKALIILLIILPFVGFTQMDSVKFQVLQRNDTTYLIGASFGDDLIGTQAFEFKTIDKIEIDSLKKGLVPSRIKGSISQNVRFISRKAQKQKRDSILKTMINAPIADFDAPDTAGFIHRPRNYQGRVLILHFWNFWDQSFENEIPLLNNLIEKYRKDGVAVLSFADIDISKDEKEYLVKHPVNFTIVPNSRTFVPKLLPLRHSIPSIILIDKQGLMRYFYIDNELINRKSDFYKDMNEPNSFEGKIISLLK
jgi:thiol-disulfide isomerase/thioredoxin